MGRREAIVLIGPTGSGKTPLGELLDARGLVARRCHHFDFGQHLRDVASGGPTAVSLKEDELQVVHDSLRTGALLTNEQFPIAKRLLVSFLRCRDVGPEGLVVLNGLPRHIGQAQDLDSLLDVRLVVYLSCTPQVISERIVTDAGGDRAGRTDDAIEAMRKRLMTFDRQTAPLVGYYRGKAAIETLEIAADTTAEDARRMLDDRAGNLLEGTR